MTQTEIDQLTTPTPTAETTLVAQTPLATAKDLRAMITDVCERIPPLWDLSNYVAVNPFLGFADQPLPEAAQTISDGLSARVLPPFSFYRKQWAAGAFGQAELQRAAERHGQNVAALEAIVHGSNPVPVRAVSPVHTLAEDHDHRYGTRLHEAVLRHVTLWCAVHVPTNGGTPWGAASEPHGLYATWRAAAQVDRSLDIAGMPGWCEWVKTLPNDPTEAIATLLHETGIAPEHYDAYLYRLLAGVYGWASFLRRSSWQANSPEPGDLAELLAIRVCTDAGVALLAPRPENHVEPRDEPAAKEDERMLAIFQEALEDGYARRLLSMLAPPPQQPAAARPAVQAFFCIDVRSEVLRRHLEAQSPQIATMGFAGFFGISVDWEADGKSSARCPVLLQPAMHLSSQASTSSAGNKLLKHVQTSPGSAFTFVETLGLAYGVTLAGDALRWFQAWHADEGHAPFSLEPDNHGGGVSPEARVQTAAFILKNMGLRETFGRLVLLCGHGSSSENNSHAAGLDCGACGGHGGAINARIAAVILNDPNVRAGLVEQGWQIPSDTYFVPAQHDTTVDEVTLFDTEQIPASHQADLKQLKEWLTQAGAATRAERASGLDLAEQPRSLIDQLIRWRSRDWSEVRPEWALARNAAFIAARRERTRGVDLAGRSFLHEYDWQTDPDNSILTLILSAPMVVASWINLQYFASTVDNEVFGCGTKALHNRIGSLGVVLGNGGDLRTGLALQSVQAADGSWYHEPLRLQVVVEAPRERIEAVFAASADVRNLVENGWVRLFALDPDSTEVVRWVPGAGWEMPW